MGEVKRVWLAPYRHLVAKDFESWLEQKAIEGWAPKKVSQLSSLVMTFEKTKPKLYRYYLDLQLH